MPAPHHLPRLLISLIAVSLLLVACQPAASPPLPSETSPPPSLTPSPSFTPLPPSPLPPTLTPSPSSTPTSNPTLTPTPTLPPLVPNFEHILLIVMENHEFGSVIGNSEMPIYNHWAQENVLLTQHYAVTHPSLPNFLALVGGDTFGVTYNCEDCFIGAPSLPDLIEASGRTWKTYQEDMPAPCFLGSSLNYVQKHNPFIYFDNIRLDSVRCQNSILPLSQLDADLAAGTLPNFVFITPNLCNGGHDCALNLVDIWLGKLVPYLLVYPGFKESGLLVLTWDEGQGEHGCCGFDPGGGRVTTLLISPLARAPLQDNTPYTHYSLLKTILQAWSLPPLGHTADPLTALIIAPWQ